MDYGADEAIRNMLRRATLVEVDDSGPQQKMRFKGLAGEEFRDVVRVQSYGFTSTPPVGSEGLIAALGGRSDRAMVLGMEHPDHRVKAAGGGASVIYDQHGNIASLVQANYRVKHSTEIVFEVGPTKVTITAAGIQIDGPALRHNTKNVGDTHTHGGIVPGGANTQNPNV